MNAMQETLEHWQLDVKGVRERMYRAATPRERERWHAIWLLACGWAAEQVAEALERDGRTIAEWIVDFEQQGPVGMRFVQPRWFPPALSQSQQAELKAAVQARPTAAGVNLAKWNWKVVRQFVQDRFGVCLSSRTCLNYLHRLGFVVKRPKKRLLKAKAELREAFVTTYASLRQEAQAQGAKIFFVDEAHFRADVDLRTQWVLRGQPALVDSSSPRFGEKATYYSAVCLETGEVEAMPVLGNTNAETSVAFLHQLHTKHTGRLTVIWDNGPAHRGPEIRQYLTTPDLNLRLVALPGYSPDFNPDEAIWDWIREDVTANTCFAKAAHVYQKVGDFFAALPQRTEEVKRRCRRDLQALADTLVAQANVVTADANHTFSPCD